MPNKWNKRQPMLRLELIEARGGACSFCPEKDPDQLEFAHVTPTELKGRGRGRKERYYDVKNNPEAYVLICKGCHKNYDDDPEYFRALEEILAPAMEALFG